MIYGLTGKAGSGKDTCADYLVANHGFTKIAFADALKRGAAEIFGVPLEKFTSGDREQIDPFWGVSYREMLQKLGTEGFRNNFGEDFWLRRLAKEMVPGKAYVVSDLRFDNEAAFIRDICGTVVHIERPGLKPVGVAGHASEAGVTSVSGDLHFINQGSIEFLHRWMGSMIGWGGSHV